MLGHLAAHVRTSGRMSEADRLLERGLTLAAATGFRQTECILLGQLATAAWQAGDGARAWTDLERAEALLDRFAELEEFAEIRALRAQFGP